MNFRKKAISIVLTMTFLSIFLATNVAASYSANTAVVYARKYAKNYCTAFNNHDEDCTNFVSQCVYFGGIAEKVNPNVPGSGIYQESNYWYSVPYKVTFYLPFIGTISSWNAWAESTTWIKVSATYDGNGFYQYMTEKENVPAADYYVGDVGENSTKLDAIIAAAKVGDVIQIRRENKDFKSHSMLVTSKYTRVDGKTDLKLCYHTNDRKDWTFRKQVHAEYWRRSDPTYTLLRFTVK